MLNSSSVPSLFADPYSNLTACYSKRDIVSAIGEWILQDEDPKDFASVFFNSVGNTTEQSNYYGDQKPVNLLVLLPNALLQMVMIIVLSHLLHLFLRRLGQSRITSQMISGILIYLFLNRERHADDVNHYLLPQPKHHRLTIDVADIAIIYHIFLSGLKIDVSETWHAGRKPVIIAIIGLSIPMLTTQLTYLSIYNQIGYHANSKNNVIKNMLDIVARPFDELLMFLFVSLCHSFFFVQAVVLSDLGLLSSELGRLALSASLIQDLMLYTLIPVFNGATQRQISMENVTMHLLFYSIVILFIILVIRPYGLWVVRNTPPNAHVSEVHVTLITLLVIVMALASDMVGASDIIGPLLMGLALPSGPPLGTALIKRIDVVATELLLPIAFLCFGREMDWAAAGQELRHGFWLVFLMLIANITRVVTVMFAAFYCGFSLKKGALLGLIMSFKGIMAPLFLIDFKFGRAINGATYTYLTIIVVTLTSICTLLVSIFYKPLDEEYNVCKNVRDLKTQSELRIITYFFNDNPIPSLLDLFECFTSSMAQHCTCVYALHLKELKGRSKSKLISHHIGNDQIVTTEMDPIHYYFLNFVKEKEERVTTMPFTSIVPQENMHQDICALIVERKISLVILPFPRKNSIASAEADQREHNLIPIILQQAQCSIGIMVYHNMTRITPTMQGHQYRIGVPFMGGPDDREVIAIAGRMLSHPFVHLKILRFNILSNNIGGKGDELEDLKTREKILDEEVINQIQRENVNNERLIINEITINDPTQIFLAIPSFGDNYDMLIVGRRRAHSSPLYNEALEEWIESPELGVIGDLLASPDFKTLANILVVQQYSSS